jgi:hypothetical protein
MNNKKSHKSQNIFECKKCKYKTSNKKDYNKHLQTKKHNNNNANKKGFFCNCGKIYKYSSGLSSHKKHCTYIKNESENENANKMLTNANFQKCPFLCGCGKSYKHKSSFSRHNKICKFSELNNSIVKYEKSEISELKDMFMKLLEKNDETNDKLMELAKEPKTTITNNNNQQFNVMNYLNTECKDAMNFSDFIEEFVFSLDDLNLLHEKGYQEAMEQTFIKQLQDMDKTKRPIHCSDKKRKSFYIKDKDIWIKDENNLKILDGVKEITHKQFGTIKQWATYNKDWLDVEKKQDFFNMSISELSKAKKEKYLNKLIIKLTSLSLK